MSYIQDNLMPNEKIFLTARIHPAVFLPSVVSFVVSVGLFTYALGTGKGQDVTSGLLAGFLLLAAAGFLLYSAVLAIRALVILITTEFAITDKRVITKRGLIRRHTLEILLSKTESISVRQNALGRLLNFGTVTITGTGGARESFGPIAEPVKVRGEIARIVEYYWGSLKDWRPVYISDNA